jgi:AraC family transcriptional regulator
MGEAGMSTRLRCIIPLFERGGARRILPVHDEASVATAQAFDWPGVMLEAGHNDVVEVDELSFAHHYLGMNTDQRPITMEVRESGGFRAVTLDPGSAWFMPAGHGFSLRVRCAGPHSYVRLALDPIRFEHRIGTSADGAAPIQLRPSYQIGGRQVQHLLGALVVEAGEGSPSGLAFIDSLTTALGMQIVQQAGVASRPPPLARGGLAAGVRRRILELMDAQSDAHLSIDALAQEAGLSPAHFARAFKQSVGRAPHQHLLTLRLERARRLLESPDAGLSDVALRAGFADQAHFTRFFKRQFGVTPGAFVRARKWRPA